MLDIIYVIVLYKQKINGKEQNSQQKLWLKAYIKSLKML